MTFLDFHKCPSFPGEIDFWSAKPTLPSKLGDFEVVLEMATDADRGVPDETMLARVNELIEFVEQNFELVEDVVFGAYLHMVRTQPRQLEICGVPPDLSRRSIPAVLSGRKLIVTRINSSRGKSYEMRITMVLDWDDEHGLTLSIDHGKIAEINGCDYRLDNEELILT